MRQQRVCTQTLLPMLVRTLREFAPTIGAAPTELAFVPSATVRVILLDSLRRAHKCCSGVTAVSSAIGAAGPLAGGAELCDRLC